jgi:hypothetical protein
MTKSELVEMMSERPFTPMLIHMNNGRAHEVRHPENAIVGDFHVALLAMRDGEEVIRVISLPHINEVERVAAGPNGEKKRPRRKPKGG